jgi:flagellar hook-basal body complex protein FliE
MSIDRVNGFRLQSPGEFGVRAFEPRRIEADAPVATPAAGELEKTTFENAVTEAVDAVSARQLEAEAKIAAFVQGEDIPLHEVVLAQEEAELSFRLMLEVRDKLLQAYQDVMRTPL